MEYKRSFWALVLNFEFQGYVVPTIIMFDLKVIHSVQKCFNEGDSCFFAIKSKLLDLSFHLKKKK